MKSNKSIFLALALFAIFASCDDDKNPSLSASLVGKWESTENETKNCTNAADNGIKECPAHGPCLTYEFKADGTYTRHLTSGAFLDEGTYTINDSKISILAGGSVELLYDLQVGGSTLTLTDSESSYPCILIYRFSKVTN